MKNEFEPNEDDFGYPTVSDFLSNENSSLETTINNIHPTQVDLMKSNDLNSNLSNHNGGSKIKSYDHFVKLFNENQLIEMSLMPHYTFVKRTSGIFFNDNEYDFQLRIYAQLKSVYATRTSSVLQHSKPITKPTVDVYDDLTSD